MSAKEIRKSLTIINESIFDEMPKLLDSINEVHGSGKAPKGECKQCDDFREKGETSHPPHNASKRCESGSKNHCSCDICF